MTAWPIVLGLLVAAWLIINFFFPIDILSVRAADAIIEEKSLKMGRPSTRERAIGLIMLGTLVAWIFGGEEFGLATIALGSVTLMFVLGLLKWSDVEPFVNWGVLLMYGGAIALGAAIHRSGAAAWVAHTLVTSWVQSPVALVAALSVAAIVLTEAMNHSAVVALLLPVALGIAQQYGIDPRVMAPAIALPAGLAFTLPVGTPANAIAYSSGYLNLRDMIIPGALLNTVAWVIFFAVAYWYWPLIGLSIRP